MVPLPAHLGKVVIGSAKDALSAAINVATSQEHHELARIWHPDRHTGIEEKAVAEAEFKRLGDAYKHLQKRLWVTGRLPACQPIDPFQGVPWYHHTRYPPWSFSRGPPYVPRAVGCASSARMQRSPALEINGAD